ncbi:MAG TPA: ribosomal protein S18-alanine N-acetyltransferase [Desulfopila sp.]|nr:ribosomal protein S18-alanine N-acetyltransferase [Desulfopila sp.]
MILHITHAGREDAAEIALLEESAPSPWPQSQIESELRQTVGIQLTARNGKPIIGWCCARLVAPECELLKITVLPHHRRWGVGAALLGELFALCSRAGCREIFLEVRQKNEQARSFYRRYGFTEAGGVRKGYYQQPPDNGVILRRRLSEPIHSTQGGPQQ